MLERDVHFIKTLPIPAPRVILAGAGMTFYWRLTDETDI
jgi:hypothetical protein